jgi:hypothetical protein
VDGKVYVFPDTSGSMQSPVTGHRTGATTHVTCLDVAALVTVPDVNYLSPLTTTTLPHRLSLATTPHSR